MTGLAALLKEYASPSSATSGLAGYDLEGQRRAKKRRLMAQLKLKMKVVKGDATTDRAAHEAATSYLNLKPQPTEDQKHAGNYKLGHIKIAGMDISIENPAGSHRRPEWPELKSHYGYIRRTEGADGDHLDCFVRVGTDEDYCGPVHVVNQVKADGSFDEHKAIIGHETSEGARQAYLENYTRDWKGLGSMKTMSMPEFKAWVFHGDTKSTLKALLGLFAKGDRPGHAFHGNRFTGGIDDGKPTTRTSRAKATHKPSTIHHHRAGAEGVKEVARLIHASAAPTEDNKPMDVEVKLGGVLHGVEVKTFTHNTNDKITMHPESLGRKQWWARKNKAVTHTVVVDMRDTFEGGKWKNHYSGNRIWYARGNGSFRLSSMTKVRDAAHLRQLMRGGK